MRGKFGKSLILQKSALQEYAKLYGIGLIRDLKRELFTHEVEEVSLKLFFV